MDYYKTTHVSVRGYSHICVGKECQDSSLSWQTRRYDAVIVCDGHGGDKYIRSAIGSQTACEVGRDVIDTFMRHLESGDAALTEKNYEDVLLRVERAIVQQWRTRIAEKLAVDPVNQDPRFAALSEKDKQSLLHKPVKAYGTTFLAAVMSKTHLFIIQIGDGNACIFRKDGAVVLPHRLDDDQLEFNRTTSLCNSDADMLFRCYYKHLDLRDNRTVGVLLSTDGIINCYPTRDKYASLVRNIFLSFIEMQRQSAKEELESVLQILSEKGSGDDMSVALICCPKLYNKRNKLNK